MTLLGGLGSTPVDISLQGSNHAAIVASNLVLTQFVSTAAALEDYPKSNHFQGERECATNTK